MKKIYTVLTAVILFALQANSQSFNNNVDDYKNDGAQIQRNSNTQMVLIQNPVKDVIILQVSNSTATQYELSLYSSNGTKVTTVLYDHPSGVSTKNISVSQFQRGMYFLVVTSMNERKSLQVLLQ